MLDVNNIQVVYNDVIMVLKGISLQVPEKGLVALLGNNGAGKSTTMKTITGILRMQNGEINEGSIAFMGERIDKKNPDEVVRMGICLVPEGRRIFEDMNVSENLMIGAYTRKDRKQVGKAYDRVIGYFPLLTRFLKQRALFLSGGEQQMLVIGRALMGKPKVMLLDEPSLGLAPLLVKEIFGILTTINKEEETALLLVEQNARAALELCGYGYIMENGKIVLDGETSRLVENEDVKEFYLGMTETKERKSYSEIKHYKRRKRWLS